MHTPTALVTNVAVTLILGISLGAVAHRSRPDGMRFWAWALGAHSLAYILFSLRGTVSDVISIVVANGLLACTLSLFAEGLYQFQQRRPPRVLIWTPVVLIVLIFSLLMQNAPARIAVSAVVFIAQCVWFLVLVLWRPRDAPGRGRYFVALGLVMAMLGFMARAVGALSGAMTVTSITASDQIQATIFLVATITIMLISLGLVLMTKERADARNLSLALEDELTGLGNRRAILEQLAHHLAQARRSSRPLAVMVLDVDHFKRINDQHGHLSGDKALRDIAACLKERLRAQDILGRWGGEEFIIVLPDTEEAGAIQLAEQLRVAVERTRFSALDGQAFALTVSIGVHALRTGYDDERDDMIGAADRALYRAKDKGRNRVEQL